MAISAEKVVMEPGSGRVVSFFGNQITLKVQKEQTTGAVSIIEALYAAGNFTPPHRHDTTDEISYILEGELGLMVAGTDFRAGPGAFVARPKGVPHALWNTTDQPVRFLDVYAPGGFEVWYWDRGGHAALLACLRHDEPAVRYIAATFLLETDPDNAVAVLEKVGASDTGFASFNAEMVLKVWREGKLKPLTRVRMGTKTMNDADWVWNRAAMDKGGEHPREGDRALADLLLVHGLSMNGGVLHAVESLKSAEFARGVAGYRYFGLDQVADLLADAAANPHVPREEELDRAYGRFIPSDQTLAAAFKERFRDRPQAFAPLDD